MRTLAFSVLLLAFTFPAAADDRMDCNKLSGDASIEACNRVINSGRFNRKDLADAYVSRGQEYYLKGNYESAISDATQAIRVGVKASVFAWANRGNAYMRVGKFDEAIADYNQALKIDPDFTAAYVGRGAGREKKGDIKGAAADYKAALSKKPKYGDGEWAHTKARERLGELQKK